MRAGFASFFADYVGIPDFIEQRLRRHLTGPSAELESIRISGEGWEVKAGVVARGGCGVTLGS